MNEQLVTLDDSALDAVNGGALSGGIGINDQNIFSFKIDLKKLQFGVKVFNWEAAVDLDVNLSVG